MDTTVIRFRLQALRERHNITQEALAQSLGFKDRQTLSQIELGERKLSSDEMLRAAKVFGVAIDYFTDPFELAGEGQFSWRQASADPQELEQFERKAGRWIAAFRHLARLRGDRIHSSLRRVALTPRSSFEAAVAEGEAIGAALQLGDVPAAGLADALQAELDTVVLHVDTVPGVSGAACQLDQLNAILINRREPAARRAYDLAHELFHLLTWHAMPPRHVESDHLGSREEKRVEQLAENFAAGLLMPSTMIRAWVEASPVPSESSARCAWLRAAAVRFGVSGAAVKWRLVNAGMLKRTVAEGLADELVRVGTDTSPTQLPKRYSRSFVEVIGWGIDEGHLSARRAATLLETSLDDLRSLFAEHALPAPFDL
jgi:XRE family transcriptional regulator, fatty acid utilization regulator